MANSAPPTDVFVIYDGGDDEAAQAFVAALKGNGLATFSDHDLKPGDVWDKVLPGKLLEARAVAILISERWPPLGQRGANWYGPTNVAIAIQQARDTDPPPRLIPVWLDGAKDRTPYGLSNLVGVHVVGRNFVAAAQRIAAVLGPPTERQAPEGTGKRPPAPAPPVEAPASPWPRRAGLLALLIAAAAAIFLLYPEPALDTTRDSGHVQPAPDAGAVGPTLTLVDPEDLSDPNDARAIWRMRRATSPENVPGPAIDIRAVLGELPQRVHVRSGLEHSIEKAQYLHCGKGADVTLHDFGPWTITKHRAPWVELSCATDKMWLLHAPKGHSNPVASAPSSTTIWKIVRAGSHHGLGAVRLESFDGRWLIVNP